MSAAAGAGAPDDDDSFLIRGPMRRRREDDDDDERDNRRRRNLMGDAQALRIAQRDAQLQTIRMIRQLFTKFRLDYGLDYYVARDVLLASFDADLVAMALVGVPSSIGPPSGRGGRAPVGPF